MFAAVIWSVLSLLIFSTAASVAFQSSWALGGAPSARSPSIHILKVGATCCLSQVETLREPRCVGIGRIEAGHRESLPIVLVVERRLAHRQCLGREHFTDTGGFLVRPTAAAGKHDHCGARTTSRRIATYPPATLFRRRLTKYTTDGPRQRGG